MATDDQQTTRFEECQATIRQPIALASPATGLNDGPRLTIVDGQLQTAEIAAAPFRWQTWKPGVFQDASTERYGDKLSLRRIGVNLAIDSNAERITPKGSDGVEIVANEADPVTGHHGNGYCPSSGRPVRYHGPEVH